MKCSLKKSTLLAIGICVAALPLLSGTTANAAIVDDDFSSGSSLYSDSTAGLTNDTVDSTEANANLDRWISRSSNRWAIGGGIADYTSTYDNGNRGMLLFTSDSTTGPLEFSFDYQLFDAGGDTGTAAIINDPPELRWSVFAFTSTNWTGGVGFEGPNGSGSVAGNDNPSTGTLLSSGLLTADATTFTTVNATISDAPVGTVMYAVRFDAFNLEPANHADYAEIDNVLLQAFVPPPAPEPSTAVLAAFGLFGLMATRRRRKRS